MALPEHHDLIAGRQYAQATLLRALIATHPKPALLATILEEYREQMLARLVPASLPDGVIDQMQEELDRYMELIAAFSRA